LGLNHGDAYVLVGLNHLHLTTNPLDDTLMKSRWDTPIDINPISSK
jgi:hypothetical protein